MSIQAAPEVGHDLSLFLPQNLPADNFWQASIEQCMKETRFASGPLQESDGLMLAVSELVLGYDDNNLSLEESIQQRSAHCLNAAALTAIAGRLLEGASIIPTVDVAWGKEDTKKMLHAYNTYLGGAGDIVRADNYCGSEYYAPPNVASTQTRIERYIVNDDSLLWHNGIVQIRALRDTSLCVRMDEETREPYENTQMIEVITLFPGEEGLKSYLKTIELISARRRKTKPKDFPAQLVPKL
jgi:hypothetical protein